MKNKKNMDKNLLEDENIDVSDMPNLNINDIFTSKNSINNNNDKELKNEVQNNDYNLIKRELQIRKKQILNMKI